MKYDDPEVIIRALARRFRANLDDVSLCSPLSEDAITMHCQAAASIFWQGLVLAGYFCVTGAKEQAIVYTSYVQ